jgi:hypothetical protein
MREFTKLNPAIFDDSRFRSVSWIEKTVYLYLMGGKHQTSAGCYKIPDGYAATDLNCDIETYAAARRALVTVGLVAFDEATSEIYILGWFIENPICNPKHAAGTERLIMQIESEVIQEVAGADFFKSKEASEKALEARTSNVSRLSNSPLVRSSSVGGRAYGG